MYSSQAKLFPSHAHNVDNKPVGDPLAALWVLLSCTMRILSTLVKHNFPRYEVWDCRNGYHIPKCTSIQHNPESTNAHTVLPWGTILICSKRPFISQNSFLVCLYVDKKKKDTMSHFSRINAGATDSYLKFFSYVRMKILHFRRSLKKKFTERRLYLKVRTTV